MSIKAALIDALYEVSDLPLLRANIPCALHLHVVPTWCEGRCRAAGGPDDEDGEHRELVLSLVYGRSSPR